MEGFEGSHHDITDKIMDIKDVPQEHINLFDAGLASLKYNYSVGMDHMKYDSHIPFTSLGHISCFGPILVGEDGFWFRHLEVSQPVEAYLADLMQMAPIVKPTVLNVFRKYTNTHLSLLPAARFRRMFDQETENFRIVETFLKDNGIKLNVIPVHLTTLDSLSFAMTFSQGTVVTWDYHEKLPLNYYDLREMK